jgi:UDP:flavonoid glycosyltransferase YjiC (YdhE family)
MVAYIKQWLDTQWERANKSPSVIYVSFGSWASLQFEQLIQITSALKRYPFIWSLKSKLQLFISSLGIDYQRHLVLDWVPQQFILSHPAIRLFISHGGWNSLLESMSAGKPTLVWPLFGDQMINGHRLEHELGMGRCIQNTDLTNGQRIVSSDELARYLKEMFDQETEYVRKAQQVQQMILRAKENSSRLYFEEIIKTVDNQMAAHMKKHNEL